MIVLGVDTSTAIASVALGVNGRVLERSERVTTFSERLLPLVDELLVEAGVRPAALDGVVCGAGPGSFTGLRIALSTCKGLCLGTGARLVMVSSLEAMATRAPRGARVLVALDAFRGDVYAGLYDVGDDGVPRAPTPSLAAFSCRPDALGATLGGVPTRYYAGEAFTKHPSAIPEGATFVDAPAPRARELLALGASRFAAGLVDDPRTAAPTYVRASAPEEDRR
jgi:tRNA threonylcarbamoyladenosine biosynthesis protein TsaB